MRWTATMLLACGLAGPLLAQTAPPAAAPGAAQAPAAEGSPAQPPTPRPVFTRQNQFGIPFSLPASSDPALAAKEVRLYVSVDRGANWKLLQAAKPDAKNIAVRTPADGEYWFLLRTLDPGGKLLPATPPRPELIVIVDSTQPGLELNLVSGSDGEMTANWRAADANLAPGSLKISYQGTDGQWREIALPRAGGEGTLTAEGSVAWRDAGTVLVRAEIQDQAGNPAVTQAQPDAATAPAAVADAAASPAATESNGSSPGWRGKPRPPAGGSQAAPSPTVSGASAARPADVQNPWLTDPVEVRRPVEPASDDHPLRAGLPWNASPAAGANGGSTNPAPPWAREPAEPTDATMTSIRKKRREEKQQPDSPPPAAASSSPGGEAPSRLAAGAGGRSVASKPWLINSRWLGLNYSAEVAADKLRTVELWATRDDGQSWHRLAIDDDKQSPITARFDDEGLYGLRLLIQKEGSVEFPPGRGDAPELWLAVDRTPPECRLTSAEEGLDGEFRQLTLFWRAADRSPIAEASDQDLTVTLLYGAHPAGPWTTIAAGIENTGRFAWQMPHHVPDAVYLKLQVQDAAGNVGEHVAEQAVTPRRPAMGQRIQSIQPRAGSAESAEFGRRNSE